MFSRLELFCEAHYAMQLKEGFAQDQDCNSRMGWKICVRVKATDVSNFSPNATRRIVQRLHKQMENIEGSNRSLTKLLLGLPQAL